MGFGLVVLGYIKPPIRGKVSQFQHGFPFATHPLSPSQLSSLGFGKAIAVAKKVCFFVFVAVDPNFVVFLAASLFFLFLF